MSVNTQATLLSVSPFKRIFGCIFRQSSRLIWCPKDIDLAGKNILITGGSSGIGEHISRRLVEAGAKVTSLSRGVSSSSAKLEQVKSIHCDLASPETIIQAVNELNDEQVDIAVLNAGIVLREYEATQSGLEKTFAVNVLGHHILLRLLIEKGILAPNGRVVFTSGEAYLNYSEKPIAADNYNPAKAYGRSKLENHWQAVELRKRFPKLMVYVIHPGVIASGFGGRPQSAVVRFIRNKILISEYEGAQAGLIAASQSLPNGAYWHNLHGVVELAEEDPVNDSTQASKLWDRLQRLAEPWLQTIERKEA